MGATRGMGGVHCHMPLVRTGSDLPLTTIFWSCREARNVFATHGCLTAILHFVFFPVNLLLHLGVESGVSPCWVFRRIYEVRTL